MPITLIKLLHIYDNGEAFTVEATTHELHLTATARRDLTNALAPYIKDFAAKPPKTFRRVFGGEAADIREWWANNPNGLPEYRDHGRLPNEVRRAWLNRNRRVESIDTLTTAALYSEAAASARLDGDTHCVDGCEDTP